MNKEIFTKLKSVLDIDCSSDLGKARREFHALSQWDKMKLYAKIDMFNFAKEECEETRHLPLKNVRDKPGKPYCYFMCNGCMKVADYPSQYKQCSKCKAVKYCSKECQIRDWLGEGRGATRPRSHKAMCDELLQMKEEFRSNQECGENLRKTLFSSWADQHHEDGSFFDMEFRARRGILGRLEVGFWAQPYNNGGPYSAAEKDASGFQNGAMLLERSFPSLKEGWKVLSDCEYPSAEAPAKPITGGVSNWREYLTLRGIESTSIAPLLLTNVLTVYQMIHHELELTKHKKDLVVYFLGVEIELNHIPLYQELAYLMPGIDLELIMVSPAAKAICKSKERRPQSILARCTDNTVLDFKDTSAGGRIRVRLADYAYLHERTLDDAMKGYPDAFIALNVGLGSYPSWEPTMAHILQMSFPFAFSEQTKVTLRFAQTEWFPSLIKSVNANSCSTHTIIQMPTLEIKLNPFHSVAGRDVTAVLVPNISNGYLLVGNKSG